MHHGQAFTFRHAGTTVEDGPCVCLFHEVGCNVHGIGRAILQGDQLFTHFHVDHTMLEHCACLCQQNLLIVARPHWSLIEVNAILTKFSGRLKHGGVDVLQEPLVEVTPVQRRKGTPNFQEIVCKLCARSEASEKQSDEKPTATLVQEASSPSEVTSNCNT